MTKVVKAKADKVVKAKAKANVTQGSDIIKKIVIKDKKLSLQKWAMGGVGIVALSLTTLSLTHLTCGIEQVTNGTWIESALMAIGIDLGFIALEVAQIIKLPEATANAVNRFAKPAILGTIMASMGLNAFGFAAHSQGIMVYPAIALGMAIPALIYALTRVTVALAK